MSDSASAAQSKALTNAIQSTVRPTDWANASQSTVGNERALNALLESAFASQGKAPTDAIQSTVGPIVAIQSTIVMDGDPCGTPSTQSPIITLISQAPA